MFWFVYCKNCALRSGNKNLLIHLLVSGPARAWNEFLASKGYKKFCNFWDAFMSLTWCSNKVQTWMKDTGFNFSFTSLYWLVHLPPFLDWVFLSFVSGFRSTFSRIAVLRKCLQMDSKSDLTTNVLMLVFFVGERILSLTLCLYGLRSASVAQLLFSFDVIKDFEV